jgi:hypothetical protein
LPPIYYPGGNRFKGQRRCGFFWISILGSAKLKGNARRPERRFVRLKNTVAPEKGKRSQIFGKMLLPWLALLRSGQQ